MFFDTPQQQAFQELKLLITNSPVLKYFDPKLPIKVSSDASKSGLGATLEQKRGENWFPVAFASRSMTPAETNYAQIEKEILSSVLLASGSTIFSTTSVSRSKKTSSKNQCSNLRLEFNDSYYAYRSTNFRLITLPERTWLSQTR